MMLYNRYSSPVKFCPIPFGVYREKVVNFSGNKRQGRPFIFGRPEKHKLGTGRLDLASCQVSLNSVRRLLRSRKSLSKSDAMAAILVSDRPEKHKLGKGRREFETFEVFNSVLRL